MSDQKTNNQLILDALIKAEKRRFPSTLSESDFFEIFAAQQTLKEKDLSDSEIETGIIGNGSDGGIDGIYFLIQGKLIQEDLRNYDAWGKNLDLDIYIIQAKTSPSFKEDTIHKFVNVTEDLFTLSHELKDRKYISRYSTKLLEVVERFKTGYLALVSKTLNLKFHYVYATRGEFVDPKVKGLTGKIEAKVKSLFRDAKFEFQFLGAGELSQLAGRTLQTKREIEYVSPAINSSDGSCICLVKMKNFFRFLKDEDATTINRHIFEANVRDYQGDVGVNKEIRDTLTNPSGENFWWLNNGITILTTGITPKGNIGLILDSPEIVNGLQTSNEVYKFFSSVPPKQLASDEREILLRIIVPPNDPTRNKIIKATNSQTKIPPFALKATDPVHWDIEQFLLPKGLYYDRRKNYYKNQGKPHASIVTMTELAQAVLAIKLARPNDARARPGSILDDEDEYKKVFSKGIPLELYYALFQIMEIIGTFLGKSILTTNEKTNLRFYLAYYAVCRCVGRVKLNNESIINAPALLTEGELRTALSVAQRLYKAAGGNDNAAKGISFIQAIERDLWERYLPQALATAKKKPASEKTNQKRAKGPATEKKTMPKKTAASGKVRFKKPTVKTVSKRDAAPRKSGKGVKMKANKTVGKKKTILKRHGK